METETTTARERWECVSTDNTRWHSNGIAGITVYETREEANADAARPRGPGKGAFVRCVWE